jgi:hypothetical protein
MTKENPMAANAASNQTMPFFKAKNRGMQEGILQENALFAGLCQAIGSDR